MQQKLKVYIETLKTWSKASQELFEIAKKDGRITLQVEFETKKRVYDSIINNLENMLKEHQKIENIRHVAINSLYGKTPDFKPGDFTPICDQTFICSKGMRGSGKIYTLFEENLKRLIREVLTENSEKGSDLHG